MKGDSACIDFWGSSCQYKRFLSCLGCCSQPSTKTVWHTAHYLTFICPHRPASWAGSHAALPVRGQFFKMTTFYIAFYESYLSTVHTTVYMQQSYSTEQSTKGSSMQEGFWINYYMIRHKDDLGSSSNSFLFFTSCNSNTRKANLWVRAWAFMWVIFILLYATFYGQIRFLFLWEYI